MRIYLSQKKYLSLLNINLQLTDTTEDSPKWSGWIFVKNNWDGVGRSKKIVQ